MASPGRPAAASVSGAFGLPPDARCSFDHPRRREVRYAALVISIFFPLGLRERETALLVGCAGREGGAGVRRRLRAAAAAAAAGRRLLPQGRRHGGRRGVHAEAGRRAAALA